MKHADFERLLLTSEGLEKLAEEARSIKRYAHEDARPASTVEPSQATCELKVAGREPPDDGTGSPVTFRPLLAGIGAFAPELADLDADQALKHLIDRCAKNPTAANQFLVEDAVNRLTSAGELKADAEKLVNRAIEVLSEKGATASASDNIWSRLYEHSDYRGRSFYVNHGPGAVYRRIRLADLGAANMNDKVSSLYVDAHASEYSGDVFLFEHDRFFGRYTKHSTTPGSPSVAHWVNYVGDFINDRTSSVLVVRRSPNEFAISLGSLGLSDRIQTYVASVPRISPRGAPVITWDMWPEGGDSHPNDPTRKFIHVKIPVRVDVPDWVDYDAEIWYWLYPYITGGHLRGYVAYYGAWVESGVKSGRILNAIMAALPPTVGTINTELASLLEITEAFGGFERVYLLPGTNDARGRTTDDVTIVLGRT